MVLGGLEDIFETYNRMQIAECRARFKKENHDWGILKRLWTVEFMSTIMTLLP